MIRYVMRGAVHRARTRGLVVSTGLSTVLWGCSPTGSSATVSDRQSDGQRPQAPGAGFEGSFPGLSSEGGAGSQFGEVSGTQGAPRELEIRVSQSVITVTGGQPLPTVQFQLYREGEQVAAPRWIVQDADIGTIDDNGLFTPRGDVGGEAVVHAYVGDRRVSTRVEVYLVSEQNGGVDTGTAEALGGYDGVGGEGPGGPVSTAQRALLSGAPIADPSLDVLYPYDETVFPLGLLSPLLMWTEGASGSTDAVRVRLHGRYYEYNGYFGRPPALAGGQPFVRHPIPQEVWKAATRTVRGGELNVEITLAVSGQARGPMKRRFTIAGGSLQGTVYYQSYGTSLIVNYSEEGVGGPYGAATLAIRPGEVAPRLIAGANDCRVCHSVSSQGQRLVTQGSDRNASFSYDLFNGDVESQYAQAGVLAWIGLSPDGSLGLGNARPLDVPEVDQTRLYDMTTGEAVPTTGLDDFVTRASFPAFSHSGRHVAFNFESGPGHSGIGPGTGRELVTMRFDPANRAFSEPKLAYAGTLPPGWPSFSPDENSLVFQAEVTRPGANYFHTRGGGEGQLWWANLLTGESNPLRALNGDGYLPRSPSTEHDADERLNFEPTVSPIATGGYAWVVFMSRRLYGNLATSPPYLSDPRRYNHRQVITTKKLWVAAVDLNLPAAQGQSAASIDPSHPAFYLPGQELHAGNSRGFWVQDPCKPDGARCSSGVECCTGVCQADLATGEPTCGLKEPGCVEELNRCQQSEDCCDPALQCINSICTAPAPVTVVR
jgi:hypothetical protein